MTLVEIYREKKMLSVFSDDRDGMSVALEDHQR
jgi:hypothetical protein